LLQPLDAEELGAQDLITVPGRERRPAPEDAAECIGPVALELPGRERREQGCDLAVSADRLRGHRWGAFLIVNRTRVRVAAQPEMRLRPAFVFMSGVAIVDQGESFEASLR
jgi:hypothetical protein